MTAYGGFMLCVLTHVLSNWLWTTSLLQRTWTWATSRRTKYGCGSRMTRWHKMSLNEISSLLWLWYRSPVRLRATLTLLLVVPVMCAPPLCLVAYHTLHTDTHLCLLKERAGKEEKGDRKTCYRGGAVYSPIVLLFRVVRTPGSRDFCSPPFIFFFFFFCIFGLVEIVCLIIILNESETVVVFSDSGLCIYQLFSFWWASRCGLSGLCNWVSFIIYLYMCLKSCIDDKNLKN